MSHDMMQEQLRRDSAMGVSRRGVLKGSGAVVAACAPFATAVGT